MISNLSKSIIIPNMTPELITKINSIIPVLLKKHISKQITISPVIAEKYRFDMHGLFKNELEMIEDFIYPHIRVNGYEASNCYDGKILTLNIINENALKTYLTLLKKEN